MSQQRRCDIWKATDGKWYLTLGDFEWAEEDSECTTYGPFSTEEDAEGELDNHSNPGGSCTDDSGTRQPPEKAKRPNGRRARF